jgi:predicted nucleic acid-binding protein
MSLEQLNQFIRRKTDTPQYKIRDIIEGMRSTRDVRETTLTVLLEATKARSIRNLVTRLRGIAGVEIDGETVRVKK